MYVVDYYIYGDNFLVINYVRWEVRNVILCLIIYNAHHQDMIIPVSGVHAIPLVKIAIRVNPMFNREIV